jgi:hypothetical protein
MKLHHFTSRDNLLKIIETGYLDTKSMETGKNIVWLTRDGIKHHQHWAMGTDKTEIRLTVSTIEIERFKIPDEPAQRHELFRLGAFTVDAIPNWYLGLKSMAVGKMEVFDPKRGRYVRDKEAYDLLPVDEDWEEIKRNSYWYRVRWGKQG